MERGVRVTGKSMSNFQSVNDQMTDNRFSYGSVQTATEDPRNFTASMSLQDKDRNYSRSFTRGTTSGHTSEDQDYNMRSMDPYNITTSKPGGKFLGLIPYGYEGKMTRNVAEGGGSKLNPYINPETLRNQVMQNKNLAVANEDYYEDAAGWQAKKDFNQVVGASNKRYAK